MCKAAVNGSTRGAVWSFPRGVAVVSAAWEPCGCGWCRAGAGKMASHQGSAWTCSWKHGRVPHSHLLLEKKEILREKKLGIREPVRRAVPWGPRRQPRGRTRAVQRTACGLHEASQEVGPTGLPPLTVE